MAAFQRLPADCGAGAAAGRRRAGHRRHLPQVAHREGHHRAQQVRAAPPSSLPRMARDVEAPLGACCTVLSWC